MHRYFVFREQWIDYNIRIRLVWCFIHCFVDQHYTSGYLGPTLQLAYYGLCYHILSFRIVVDLSVSCNVFAIKGKALRTDILILGLITVFNISFSPCYLFFCDFCTFLYFIHC